MPCRAGIITRPDERKKEWRIKHPTMRAWTVVGPIPIVKLHRIGKTDKPCVKGMVVEMNLICPEPNGTVIDLITNLSSSLAISNLAF